MGKKKLYSCEECPAACCANFVPYVHLSEGEIYQIALHRRVDPREMRDKLTRPDPSDDLRHDEAGLPFRLLRRKADPVIFGKGNETPKPDVCVFLDLNTRRCTVYEVRPDTCRDFPPKKRCGYYDFLKFARDQQDDEGVIIIAEIVRSV